MTPLDLKHAFDQFEGYFNLNHKVTQHGAYKFVLGIREIQINSQSLQEFINRSAFKFCMGMQIS